MSDQTTPLAETPREGRSTDPAPAMETEAVAPRSASPLFLGMVGLALMLVGWFASQWSPPRAPSPLDDLRRLADDDLRARLENLAPPYRPLQWPGRLGLFLGVGLFVLAGVKMYRSEGATTQAGEEKR